LCRKYATVLAKAQRGGIIRLCFIIQGSAIKTAIKALLEKYTTYKLKKSGKGALMFSINNANPIHVFDLSRKTKRKEFDGIPPSPLDHPPKIHTQ